MPRADRRWERVVAVVAAEVALVALTAVVVLFVVEVTVDRIEPIPIDAIAVSTDGMRLTAVSGTCGVEVLTASESDDSVMVRRLSDSDRCGAAQIITVHLAEPLGDRTVIDSFDGSNVKVSTAE